MMTNHFPLAKVELSKIFSQRDNDNNNFTTTTTTTTTTRLKTMCLEPQVCFIFFIYLFFPTKWLFTARLRQQRQWQHGQHGAIDDHIHSDHYHDHDTSKVPAVATKYPTTTQGLENRYVFGSFLFFFHYLLIIYRLSPPSSSIYTLLSIVHHMVWGMLDRLIFTQKLIYLLY